MSEYWVELLGRERADQISARPGHSGHQLGLAADITGPSCSDWECSWMMTTRGQVYPDRYQPTAVRDGTGF